MEVVISPSERPGGLTIEAKSNLDDEKAFRVSKDCVSGGGEGHDLGVNRNTHTRPQGFFFPLSFLVSQISLQIAQ